MRKQLKTIETISFRVHVIQRDIDEGKCGLISKCGLTVAISLHSACALLPLPARRPDQMKNSRRPPTDGRRYGPILPQADQPG